MMLQSHSGAAPAIFTPASLPTAKHWLDALDTDTVWTTAARSTPTTVGNPVGSWKDKVGNLYWYQTDANSTRRPTLTATGLSFDGSNDYLGTELSQITWPKVAEQSIRVFVISTPTVVTGDRTLFALGGYWANGITCQFVSSKLKAQIGVGGGLNFFRVSTASVTTAKQLSEINMLAEVANHPLAVIVNNGVKTDTIETGFSFTPGYHPSDTLSCIGAVTSGFTVDGVWYFSGTIQEIVITGALTTDEYNALMLYFQTRHGVSLGV